VHDGKGGVSCDGMACLSKFGPANRTVTRLTSTGSLACLSKFDGLACPSSRPTRDARSPSPLACLSKFG
jgi:hypothetical protein